MFDFRLTDPSLVCSFLPGCEGDKLKMAAQTAFSVEMFPVGVPLMEGSPNISDMPKDTPPAPQLVMLANVAAVTAVGETGGCDGSTADEKEMMELKTVSSSYSDSEDEGVIRSVSSNSHPPVTSKELSASRT